MACLITSLVFVALTSIPYPALSQATTAVSTINAPANVSDFLPQLGAQDLDPNFSWKIAYDDTDIPATPTFMNVIELMAQYAEKDPMTGRVKQRRGMVLPNFPQVEIAVLPPEPSLSGSIEMLLVVWGLYAMCADMVFKNKFKQAEMAIRWKQEDMGSLFITLPLDDDDDDSSSSSLNMTALRTIPALPASSTNITYTSPALQANIFDWTPAWKPRGEIIPPTDVFLMAMGIIKSVADVPVQRKVPQAFFIGSWLVNVNTQIIFYRGVKPRTRPPFLQYIHVLEMARRMSAWMYGQRKFAEFFCTLKVNGVPVGQALLEKGRIPAGGTSLQGVVVGENGTLSEA